MQYKSVFTMSLGGIEVKDTPRGSTLETVIDAWAWATGNLKAAGISVILFCNTLVIQYESFYSEEMPWLFSLESQRLSGSDLHL